MDAVYSKAIKVQNAKYFKFIWMTWGSLRTFARKFSNLGCFLQILPLKDDELVMSEM